MVGRLLIAVAVCATALLAAQPIAAGGREDVHVSGRYTVADFGTTTCTPKGASSYVCKTTGFVSLYEGSLTGSTTTDFEWMIDCKKGRTRGQGVETFTGSVAGLGSGTLTWRIRFGSNFDCSTFTESSFAGTGEIRSGTGDLARLDGELEFGPDTYVGELSRRAHSDERQGINDQNAA